MGRPTRAFALRLAGLTAAGVALRALYLLTVGRHVTGIGDWHFYHWQANLIADGHGFIEPYKWLFEHRPSPSAGHPPLYPLALSAVSLLGGTSELSHRALGLILGAVTIVLVGLLGRRAGGERTGLLAAGLCAGYPLMIAVDGALMSETLYGPLVVLALLAAWRLIDAPGALAAVVAGVAIGVAASARSEALLLVPLLAWPAAWRGGAGWPLRAVLATLGCLVALAPWTIRNADRFGALVPVSTNDATVIAGANCPLTYSGADLGGWNIRCISERRDDNEARQAAIWRREGVDYATGHVSRWPVLAAVRWLRVWDLYQPRRQVMFAEGRQRRVEQAGVVVYGLLALLALGGVAVLWRTRRRDALLVLLAPAVVVSVSAVIGYGVPRLRHAFEMGMLVLAAVALAGLWERRRAA
ncbi:MAG: glycosyltransferase family 39 protein [Solirubrobacteraceae bacterium]